MKRLVSSRRIVKVALSVAIFSVVALSAAVAASADTVKFSSTGEEQTFRVPAGVTSIHVVATGARGGSTLSPRGPGFGATVTGDLQVSPLQLLYVEVGGNGGSASGQAGGAGGFNGGGNAGTSGDAAGNGGGGGGGATDLRLVPRSAGNSSLESRLITAAGGGGSGGSVGANEGGSGGSANSNGSGGGGQTGGGAGGGEGATGATTSAPGGKFSLIGSLGTGGPGQSGSAMVVNGAGAGGGGGLFGGGGGVTGSGPTGGGGGGAGSSGVGSSVKNSSIATDNTGVPLVTITYTLPNNGGNGGGNNGGGGNPAALDTTIDAHPAKLIETRNEKRRVGFRFSANQAGASFVCKIDFNSFAPCESPKKYRLSLGRHTFKVKAVGDATPAVYSFRIKHK